MTVSASSKHAVTFVLITIFLDMVGFGIVMPVLPQLIGNVGHMDIADAAIIGGWLLVAFSLTQFLFSPTMGNLSDAYGRRPMLLLAVFGLFIDYMLMALAPNLVWLFVGRAIAGLCGASYVIANAYIADVTSPENRAKAFGLVGAAFGMGFVIGPAIGGILGEYGPRVPFYAAAAISALNLVYGFFVVPESLAVANRRPFDWTRANPFGTFRVFANYRGILPLCGVLFIYFFATSVYPAIWAFWGIGKFGWSASVVGISLAAFGLIAAVVQGGLTGPAVKIFGEERLALIGIIAAVIATTGFGLAPSLIFVIAVLVIHAPEGFVHPMLTTIMSKAVPENAQGELQGGLASLMSISMLLGTVFFAQIFGFFMHEDAPYRSPDVAYYTASALLLLTAVLFVLVRRNKA